MSKRAVRATPRGVLALFMATGMISAGMALLAAPLPAAAGTPLPGAPNCAMFPSDNVWNTNISELPVDPHSAEWMASMDSATTNLHPDFGPSGDPSTPYGIPYTVVSPSQPLVDVTFQYASESDPGPYPFGPATPIEGGAQSTGDRHALMVNPTTCTLYELYDAQYSPSGSTAGSGAIWNLESNALRPSGWTSADAAGLPILPGLVRYDEVESGAITHAIRMTAESTDTSFIWPARHEAGSSSNPDLPPMGARFRLKASYDISGYSPQAQVVLRAMQQYGLILADNGSNWYFGGTADPAWPSALVNELKEVPASAFEAVDESSLMVDPNSGQARQVGGAVSCSTAPGYRLAAADGGVFSFCAPFYGSMGGHTLNQPIVGMAATPDGKGYWLVAADGGIFTFGDAGFYGSTGTCTQRAHRGHGRHARRQGYWLVAADGASSPSGTPLLRLHRTCISTSPSWAWPPRPTEAATGWWRRTGASSPSATPASTAPPGGSASTSPSWAWPPRPTEAVLAGGQGRGHLHLRRCRFDGSTGDLRLDAPIVGMAATPDGGGYWLVAADGGVFTFGDAPFDGSAGSNGLVAPIVAASG